MMPTRKRKILRKNLKVDSIYHHNMKAKLTLFYFLITVSIASIQQLTANSQSSTESSLQANDFTASPEELFQQARSLLFGKGVKKDNAKAFQLMKAAADQGHADAMGGLGFFYSKGIAVKKDEAKALEYFRKGAEKGSAKSQLNLGKSLLKSNGGNPDQQKITEAIKWILKAADQKLPEAALAYGTYCYFGEQSVSQDYQRAASCFLIAAESGIAEAQNYLGAMHENGQGFPTNQDLAIDWYRKAALQNHLRAQANLGRTIGTNNNDPKQRTEALAWLTIAAQKGDVTAEKALMEVDSSLTPTDQQHIKERVASIRIEIKPADQAVD